MSIFKNRLLFFLLLALLKAVNLSTRPQTLVKPLFFCTFVQNNMSKPESILHCVLLTKDEMDMSGGDVCSWIHLYFNISLQRKDVYLLLGEFCL